MPSNRPPRNRKTTARYRAKKKIRRARKKALSPHGRRSKAKYSTRKVRKKD